MDAEKIGGVSPSHRYGLTSLCEAYSLLCLSLHRKNSHGSMRSARSRCLGPPSFARCSARLGSAGEIDTICSWTHLPVDYCS